MDAPSVMPSFAHWGNFGRLLSNSDQCLLCFARLRVATATLLRNWGVWDVGLSLGSACD